MTQFSTIAKYDVYNERMAASMLDKVYFLDKVGDSDVFVDFGCADGTLFRYMRPFAPDATLIGYDTDPEMCKKAKENIPDGFFCSYWDTVEELVKKHRELGRKVTLILSSVIHEVYHYGDPKSIDDFWARVWGTGFEFIVLRDMIPSESIDRLSTVNDVSKVLRKWRNSPALKDFERKWGSIEANKNLIHFLLKHKYVTPNWDREVKENYFPLYREDFLADVPDGYDILYHEHYVLPYIRREVKKDFGIDIIDPTHLKIILQRL
jgi:hypothetical protein